jgi:pimeloyl-ACP methyl ester carboxylesterase
VAPVTRVELTIDGRQLSVYDEGRRDGPAILCHHGTPLAGPPFAPWVQDAATRGARLITYDRPGYAGSSPVRGRDVASAAHDSAAIMEALGIERFATWGISGGAPHALACAALLPDRVTAAASVAGIAPFTAAGLNYFRGMGDANIAEFGLAMAGREYIEPWAEQAGAAMLETSAGELAESIGTLVSASDAPFVEGAVGQYWSSALAVTFAQGAVGWIDDDLALVLPFGFDLEEIKVPALVVHGHEDRFVPLDHGIWLAAAIPGAEARLLEQEGHLSLYVNAVPAAHAWLLAYA